MDETKKVSCSFEFTRTLKQRDFRLAEMSTNAAILLMSEFAVDDQGKTLPYDDFIAIVDEMDDLEFWQFFMKFRQASVPKVNGRR